MISKCVLDFLKKYKKYIFIICIVFALIFLWKLSNKQESLDGSTGAAGAGLTVGAFFSYCCGVMCCGCLVPFCIMYFITKASASAAIESTPCRSIISQGMVPQQ